LERDLFILRAVQDLLIPEYRPDVLVVWLDELDHAQHAHGLGSPETTATLMNIDRLLKRFLETIERHCGTESVTCFLLSDHGFSTISERVDVDRSLVAAGLKESPDSIDIVRASQSLYLVGKARERLGDVVHFLQEQPWIGAVFVRDDLIEMGPVAMPQSAVFGAHRRSAEITFAHRWSPAENTQGIPGFVAGGEQNVATHGSASPYDFNTCLVAWGKGIEEGVISVVPCGIVDLAPTVLHLLGISPPADMDGRVLSEMLKQGLPPDISAVSREVREIQYETAIGSRHQVATYSNLNGIRYLDCVTATV
jgi:predicted AlkP superfamily pyrophosphatase or phosphodiesterase